MVGTIYKIQRYTRKMIEENKYTFFVFGDNLKRIGLAGQASAARGNTNAIGIPTKVSPSNDEDAFFSDDQKIVWKDTEDFKKLYFYLSHGYDIVLPEDGLGTGLSKLPEKSPENYRNLEKAIYELVCFSKKQAPEDYPFWTAKDYRKAYINIIDDFFVVS